MALLKIFLCALLVTMAVGEEEESGQYSPEKYEKPYEAEESTPDAETPEPVEPLPEVVAVKTALPFALPYPLSVHAVYSDPQAFRFAGAFPVVVV